MSGKTIAELEVAKDEFLRKLADIGLTAQEAHKALIELANRIGYACNDVKLSAVFPTTPPRIPTSRMRFAETANG